MVLGALERPQMVSASYVTLWGGWRFLHTLLWASWGVWNDGRSSTGEPLSSTSAETPVRGTPVRIFLPDYLRQGLWLAGHIKGHGKRKLWSLPPWPYILWQDRLSCFYDISSPTSELISLGFQYRLKPVSLQNSTLSLWAIQPHGPNRYMILSLSSVKRPLLDYLDGIL